MGSVAALMLALWMPVTMHCALEALPGFGFLQCCCGGDEASQTPHDCEDDFCGEVESGSYRIEDNPAITPGLAPLVALAPSDGVAAGTAEAQPHWMPASSAPPELSRFWQFSRRTALPPRAPSRIA